MATHSIGRQEDARRGIADEGAMTISAASKFSGLSRSMLYSLMGQGKLPWLKIGSARRIPISALKDLLASSVHGGEQVAL